jgi:negative regulator of replication initiation
MSKPHKKQFNDGEVSLASAYEIIVLFNQLSGFDVEIDVLLAELIPLLDKSAFINADLPPERFSSILQYHLKNSFAALSDTAPSDHVRTRMYFASQGIVLPE